MVTKMKAKELAVYKTYEENIDAQLERHTNNLINLLDEKQRPALLDFRKHMILEGLTKYSIIFYIGNLSRMLRSIKKPAEDLTKEDIVDYLVTLKDRNQRTRHNIYLSLLKFLKWLGKYDHIKDIKIKKRLHIKLPEEILSLDEIKRMVQVTTNQRDKALIFMLYETAARKGELLSLKVKHIQFDEYGAVVILPQGKTGSRRLGPFFFP